MFIEPKSSISTIANLVLKYMKLGILDQVGHFKKIYSMLQREQKLNEEAAEMIGQFGEEYMKNGWQLVSFGIRFITSVYFFNAILFL